MMRHRLLALVALCAAFALTRDARAETVNVNFGGLTNPVDITEPIAEGAANTLDGITFRYDPQGGGFAQLDAAGVYGSPNGSLIFDFVVPAKSLKFDFALLGASQSVEDGLSIIFKKGGSDVTDRFVAATFDGINDALGTLDYNGKDFDQAIMYFSVGTEAAPIPYFSVSNLSYEAVPEPATVVLLISGLFSLGAWNLMKRKGSR